MDTDVTPGDQLRKEREDADISLNDLAQAMGAHRSTVWRYEGMLSVPESIVTRYRDALASLTRKAVA